jgi:hypothetical protein
VAFTLLIQKAEGNDMEVTQITNETTPCGDPLPELEVPMINAMVSCLGSEHRKLDEHILHLALAATRLESNVDSVTANQCAAEAWNQIRSYLWSHLQIEDELVFSWGGAHQAIPKALLKALLLERQEMRKLLAALPSSPPSEHAQPQTAERAAFAQALLALARTLDSHVARYDADVLPSISRALFHKS